MVIHQNKNNTHYFYRFPSWSVHLWTSLIDSQPKRTLFLVRYHPSWLCSPVEFDFALPHTPDIIIFLCFPGSSDPVIELMLQSVPDPFDSYGQPHAEDQIFSILPPLSILAPSSSPSPMMVSPQTVTSDIFATGTSARWAHSNGTLYSDTASDWADVLPSSASSALLATPTKAHSSGSPSRRPNRPSSPPGSSSRRAESKLRSVLSVIDESQQQPRHNDDAAPSAATAAAATTMDTPDDAAAMNGTSSSPVAAREADANWPGFPFGEFPRSTSQDTTPRNSISGPASPTLDIHPGLDTPGRRTPESDRTTLPIAT